jgi:glycosyltransferase involved in cell wall biosynthesis
MPAASGKALAYVVNSLGHGGTEKLVVEMSRAFSSEFRVEVFCLDEPGLWAAELRRIGVPVHCLWRQPGLDLEMARKLAAHFRRMRAAVVHAHQCTPWFYAALSRMLHPRPRLLLEEHGRFYPESDHRLRRIVNVALIARLTHRFVAVSADVRARLARYEGLDAKRIEVVYNGVRPARALGAEARAATRRALGFGSEHFVVGTVGRFDPIKNLPLLVESIDRAGGAAQQVRGLLVGDGPAAGEIRALVASRGLSARVRFTGFRDDARDLVQCLDLFVLSSLSEGTSMALLEAMAAGVPVLVTAVGGNVEVVEDGVSGSVVPSKHAAAMTEAILAAVREPERAAERARVGRQRFAERFSFDGMLAAYGRIYSELLAQLAGVPAGQPRMP